MQKRTKLILAAAAVVGTVAGGAGIAVASGTVGGDDSEAPITGEALDRATAAALDHLGEGRVTETEVGDEDSYYEVEVTLSDGRQVDVQLDEGFNVVGQMADSETDPDDTD